MLNERDYEDRGNPYSSRYGGHWFFRCRFWVR